VPLIATLLGCTLAATAIGPHLVLDDYVLLLRARGDATLWPQSFDLFTFTSGDPAENRQLMDQGLLLPWWASTSLKLVFFRPLSSLTHRLDAWLWPSAPAAMYLHNLLWFGLCLWLVARVYRRFEGSTVVASLAALLFAIDDVHGPVVSWISNRNALVAACFGLAFLLAHDRARRDGSRFARLLAPCYLALALAAGELGASVIGYLAGYVLFIDPGSRRRRLLSLAPPTVVVTGWALLYHSSGAGAQSSGVYVHPLQDPLGFLALLPTRAASLLAGAVGPIPSDLSFLDHPERQSLWLLAALAIVLAFAVAWMAELKRDRVARFWLTGALLGIVPIAASFPSDRLLLLVSVGTTPLVARVLSAAVLTRTWQRSSPPARLFVVACAAVHLCLAPLLLPLRAAQMQVLGRSLDVAWGALDALSDIEQRTVVLINPPTDFFAAYVQADHAWLGRARPRQLYWLATANRAVTLRRLDASTLQIQHHGGLLSTPLERHYRSADEALPVAARVELSGMTATVVATTSDGRPETVDFTFEHSLDSRRYSFLVWKRDRFEVFTLGPTGSELDLPAEDLGEILTRTALEDS
jgi:hypothetical protein